MDDFRLPLRKKTVIGWAMAMVVCLGVIGYEWLPATLRGAWLFYLALVLLGAVMTVGGGIILGLLMFLGMALYLSYSQLIGVSAERYYSMLFLVPLAPLWLSAIMYNLRLRSGTEEQYWAVEDFSNTDLASHEAQHLMLRTLKTLVKDGHLQSLREIRIHVINVSVIREVLGERAWLSIKQQLFDIFAKVKHPALLHFSDRREGCFMTLDFRDEASPLTFMDEMKQIKGVKIEIHTKTHGASAQESVS